MKDKTARQLMLEEAIQIVTKDRASCYGSPEDNFRNIANLWNCHLSAQKHAVVLSSADVAIMMILMKIARLSTNPTHYDSCLDVAGYAACLRDIQLTMIPAKEMPNETNEPYDPYNTDNS